MLPGDVVADRFAIEQHAAAGGMGTVYRARDLAEGVLVALKVVTGVGGDAGRFAREAAVLAELQHPRIVRYLGHGTTPQGDGWLAMEWLEGEDAGARLARAGLDLRESLALVRGAAEGLAAAHRRGVVHRDVKPGNLFLPGLAVERVKVLDFGIARMAGAGRGPTRTGAIVGTPAYMAPEQARGGGAVGPAADVFALGCLLFECVTGRPPFAGENVMAVLAKVLLAAPPPASSIRPELPEGIDDLLSALLAKDPARRLADGAAVVAAIDDLGDVASTSAPAAAARTPFLGALEQRVVCVVVVPPLAGTDGHATTVLDRDAVGIDPEASAIEAARRAIEPLGGRLEWLADGSVVVSVLGEGTATDQATRAARCALALLPVLGARPVYVATGRGVVGGRAPVGDVVDRAVEALAQHHDPGVWLDEATALLLGDRFTIETTARGALLRGDREQIAPGRRLLGRATGFVGREREVATLAGLFEEAALESVARVAVVVAPAGAGKTRLLGELVRRVEADASPLVLSGEGDPSRAGSPWGLLGPAIRRVAGVPAGATPEVARVALEHRVDRVLAGPDAPRAAAFLGAVAGLPPSPTAPADVRAALDDPTLLAEGVASSWVSWLEAESTEAPIVIALDDLQWGDLPSIKLVDVALRALVARPLFVLAAGRPELRDAFPSLWQGRDAQELRLGALTPRAAERLVRGALGEAAEEQVVASIVDRGQGNAFFLEELVRAAASGDGRALPDSVLGTVQARLDAIGPEARRVLRAASVFGLTFWRSGVAHLLGGEQRTTAVGEWLEDLERREVVVRRPWSTVPGDVEYGFPHALLRDAAYAMLTPEDRVLGHQLAAGWLGARRDVDPVVLAEHWSAGNQPARAAAAFVAAAEQARAASDLRASLERARRAIACGAEGAVRGEARTLEAEALHAAGANDASLAAAQEALTLLPVGSRAWYLALTFGVMAAARAHQLAIAEDMARFALAAPADGDGVEDRRWLCLCTCARQMIHTRLPFGDALLQAMDASPPDEAQLGPQTLGTLVELRARRAQRQGDLGATVSGLEAALAAIERVASPYLAVPYSVHLAMALIDVGDLARAEELATRAHAAAARSEAGPASYASYALVKVLLRQGRVAEARRIHAATTWSTTETRMIAWEAWMRASLLRGEGDLEGAIAAARDAVASGAVPPIRATMLGLLADLLLDAGRPAEAAVAVAEAVTLATASGETVDEELRIALTHVRALRANGEDGAAAVALAEARDRLARRAATLDPARRALYLDQPEARAIADG